jgi:hypothetical protein
MRKLLLSICLGLAFPHGLEADALPEEGKKIHADPAAERQYQERSEKRKQAYEMQARKYAEAQALLRVEADPGDCLATHNQRGVCLVDAQAFNQAVVSVEPDHGLGATAEEKRERIGRTRRALLRQMLQGDFLADALKATGLEDEVVKRAKDAEARKMAQAAKAIGEARLRGIYARYGEAFAAHESRVYQVLASTDSLWIDSLSKLPVSANSRFPQSRAPWVSVPDTLMPAELAKAAASLKKKKSEITVAWKAGFARIRLASSHVSPAVPFEQALPTLVGLVPNAEPDSLQALREAKAYYAAHPSEFRNPDTLELDAALAPGEAADATVSRKAVPIRLQNLELPEQAALWLARLPTRPEARSGLPTGRDSLRAGATLGPVFLGVGTWTFKINAIRKSAGLVRFEAAREGLEALLRRRRMERELSEALDARLDKNRTLGMAIFEELLNERHVPDEAELSRRMQADSSTVVAALPPGTPPEQVQENLKTFSLMNLAQASRDGSYATWLKESVTLAKIDPD